MNDHDPTENARRVYQAVTNALPDSALPEQTWTTEELTRDFEVQGFMAPFVVVVRKSDGKKGSLRFRHNPRVYFEWKEHTP
jgi:hypothetical protein